MADQTHIEWCDSTFNPWVGCTKISPACDHCYAEGWAKRSGMVKWGNEPRRRTSDSNWREPLKWQATAAEFERLHGHRRRVFCASLADVFDNQVPDEWRHDLWSLIEQCWGMDWLLLTKRPQNIAKMLPDTATWENIRRHVWLGTTVEDQERANQNIWHLLKHDAAVRFVSIEPMLGPIDLNRVIFHPNSAEHFTVDALLGRVRSGGGWVEAPEFTGVPPYMRGLNWVIAGGESGPHARPSHPDWFRSLRDKCAAARVPFLFKQWGEWAPGSNFPTAIPSGQACDFDDRSLGDDGVVWKVGKKAAGRLLDGVEHNGMPVVALTMGKA